MKNLLKWELKQTFSTKLFWLTGMILMAATLLLMLIPLAESGRTGFEIFLHGCNDFNSLLLLFIGIFAGSHIAGAFEQRRIQAAVMAGNSRLKVLSAKLISFSLSIALFSIATLSASAILAFSTKGLSGMEGSFFREIIIRIAAYTLVEVSFVSVCFLLSTQFKSLGSAITANFVGLLLLNTLAQMLMDKEWASIFMTLTPVGQTFLVLIDASTKNILFSLLASAMGLVFVLTFSYMRFRKEELK
ncbi:MAG: hypothetical protein E7331_09460 [Clostridiales bacterium]|nr:hypothetical protein [Clostridiales bacterium]